MALTHLIDWLSQQGNLPNKLTSAMGELVRAARLEAGLKQSELAERIYRRQAALSDIENGKMRMDVETLVYLSATLDKPIIYFFPKNLLHHQLADEFLTDKEYYLLKQFRSLEEDDQKRVMRVVDKLVGVEGFITNLITESIPLIDNSGNAENEEPRDENNQ